MSSSSSSSDYCRFPDCTGNLCPHLTNWEIYLSDQSVKEIYVLTTFFPSTNTQQVELYGDESYFNILAIGQASPLIASTMNLDEVDSSGLTGTVDWDATPLDYSYSAVLNCDGFSSSSSSSSLDSSSESSQTTISESSDSSSSSSSQCCSFLFCEGAACLNFSSWNFSGFNKSNTTDCEVFVGLFVQGAKQQVRVYKDPSLIYLVSVGESPTSGVINLIEQNDSGLTGSTVWDGTLLDFPNYLILSCNEFSSSSSSSSSSIDSSSSSTYFYSTSSSSSSSSIDSSSSSSSELYSSSSSSSTSISSSSSETSDSSSSSSSIDSSSSSSESFGNFSSSSSSSGVFWDEKKPLVLGISSAADITNNNRVAQTFFVSSEEYSIGNLYIYLFTNSAFSSAYAINMSIFDCENDGSPKNEIFSSSIDSSAVSSDGWYKFEFGTANQITPANGYLSIVLSHDGSEDEYVLWGYSKKNQEAGFKSWLSSDGMIWQDYEDALFSFRVTDTYNPFNSAENNILAPPTDPATNFTDELEYSDIAYENAIVSFVVDSSGSMGEMDRYNNRADFIGCITDNFIANYPSEFLFDIFSFGGNDIDSSSIFSSLGSFQTINLDLGEPDRTTYIFEVSGSFAKKGSVYQNNGKTYEVLATIDSQQTKLLAYGDSDPGGGTVLYLVSGDGDAEILFSSFSSVSIEDDMIAYGFKGFEQSHQYNIGELSSNFETIDGVEERNWQLFHPSSEVASLSLGNNAPNNELSIDIDASANLISRKILTGLGILTSELLETIYVGDETLKVSDSSIFSVGDLIDITSGDSSNMSREILEINGNEITFSPPISLPIESNSKSGSIVHATISDEAQVINNATTLKLLVRDVDVTRDITFYFQNKEGYYIEWDFKPLPEWTSYNIFFLGETANLPMYFFDEDGSPLPDGTKVEILVNKKPVEIEKSEDESLLVSKFSPAGDNKIYVGGTDGYQRGDLIDISDANGNVQTSKIEEIGGGEEGPYVVIAGVLQFDVSPELGTTIRKNTEESPRATSSNNRVSVSVSAVDVTTIVNGKDISGSLLKPYDISRVPPSTPYEDLNISRDFIQRNTLDMPTIDSNVCLRILPITEDILETTREKELDQNRVTRYSETIDISPQLERNDGDSEKVIETSQESETFSQGDEVDYSIETPVFTTNGVALSSMQSFASELTEEDGESYPAITIPGIENPVFLSKNYEIYSYASFLSEEGRETSRLYLDPFTLSFFSPINLSSEYAENSEVGYYLSDPENESCSLSYTKKFVRGNYASSGGKITINYIVAEEFSLSINGFINIRLYSDRVSDLESVASEISFGGGKISQQFVNIKPLRKITQDPNGEQTDAYETPIDKWRAAVSNNPFVNVINSQNQNNESLSALEDRRSLSDDIIDSYSDQFNLESGAAQASGQGSIFYSDPGRWTFAEQYGEYEFSIPIENGKASFEIPETDVVSLLFVEATVNFAEDGEHIIADAFFVANPISIGQINPANIVPAENQVYEMGVSLEYFGESSQLEDNVQVSFSIAEESVRAKIEPSSSVTDNGWAGGAFIGPLDPIPPTPISPGSGNVCPASSDIDILIEAYHPSGYARRATRVIRLSSSSFDSEVDSFLFFAESATESTYADGSVSSTAKVTIDLDDALNPTDIYVGEDGVSRLKGYDQPDNQPRTLTAFSSLPKKSQWSDNKIELRPLSFNKSIGHPQALSSGELFLEPWSRQINAYTSYLNGDGNYARGEIASGLPFLSPGGGTVIPKPVQKYKEPLGIEVAKEGTFLRDGVSSMNICATLTWRGEPIRDTVLINQGTELESMISYPLPKVTFESGICKEENIKRGTTVNRAKDARNLISGCLVIGENQDIRLDSYSVQSGFFRSDIHTDYDGSGGILSQHTHEIELDDEGNGATISTINIIGVTPNHSHGYQDFSSNESLGHSHSFRCVAIASVLPTSNTDTDFVINGKVNYDPTGCDPFEEEPENPDGNRIMFSTLRLPARNDLARSLASRIEVGSDLKNNEPIFVLDYESNEDSLISSQQEASVTFYTAKDVEQTERGFDVRIIAKFPEYVYIDDMGNEVTVPDEYLEDGSRVTAEITPFRGESSEDFVVMGDNIKRNYMNLKIKTSATSGLFVSEREIIISIASIQKWYPQINHLLPGLTRDPLYISRAISEIGFFGSSQINDAVKKAAESLSQYELEKDGLNDYKKIIFIISDGDENTSDNSINQAIDSVNFVDGKNNIDVFSVALGVSHRSDSIIMEKYSETGEGKVFFVKDKTSSEMLDFCNSVISGGNLSINQQTISGEIVFNSENAPSRISISGASLPAGTEILYRTRSSLDGIIYTSWSRYRDSGEDIWYGKDKENLQKYVQYEIVFYGNSEFDSPSVSEGFSVDYYDPREFLIFFQPINISIDEDEYVSSIQIAYQSNKNDASEIGFLYSQSSSVDASEYIDIEPDEHTILNTRFNEIAITENFITYRPVGGSWNSNYTVEVNKVNNQTGDTSEVPSGEYSLNNKEGTINFISSQDPSYTITINIFFSSSFRIIAKIKNYVDEPVSIDHIGVVYNVSKRVFSDENGNTVTVPISRRINDD